MSLGKCGKLQPVLLITESGLLQTWFYSRVVIDPSPLFFRSGVLGKSFESLGEDPQWEPSRVFCFLGQSEWEAPWLYSLLANTRHFGFSCSYFCLHQRGKEALKSSPLQMQLKTYTGIYF